MRKAQRDQTETRDAIKELDTFVLRFPNSDLMPEVKTKLREAHDRLSEADYLVGFFYYRQKWYPGAIDRFQAVLKDDAEYTHRDAVYFHLAESFVKGKVEARALPYYERLVEEFQQSEYLEAAKKRITEIKASMAAKATASP
jgi:outer membrane assembly lipoprotein YfiO